MFGKMLVLLCVWLTVPGVARAGDVAFSSVLPNGAMYTGQVESMRERRFRNLVRQHTDYSCGAAALATILKHAYHLNTDEATVIEGMMGVADPELVRQRGFSLLDIKRYVESLGMRGRGYRVDEERLKSLRVPGLVLMDVRGFRHFVVLKQVRDDVAEIGDPILGNRAIPLDEFVRAWPSRAVFVVIGSDFDRNTVLLQPSERPSARALAARQGRGPITDAELVDFGFTHADLF
ncbi:peptidase [Stenotrophomonas sp. ATCM1_4]|uniref:C39 family peptidase n=1 Tax=Stenotrophomonas capsici TaxID=3110230 RepID=A0ABU5V156_9GAMM|nr:MULTISPECIES: C39 family peptidase [unclassified Stenotrophomonas]MEA5666494.1 C39 family peptidase [Stenotrophomonas sp. MH1]TDB27980.1 peptidase [Stenotrophomonas sp. ATCM1_4]